MTYFVILSLTTLTAVF